MQGGGNAPRLGHFTVTNLRNILRNKSYAGIKTYQTKSGQTKEAKAVWEPMVDAYSFEATQDLLSKNFCRFKPRITGSLPIHSLRDALLRNLWRKALRENGQRERRKIAYYEHGWATKRQACLVKKVFACNPNRILAKRLKPAVWKELETLIQDPTVAERFLKRPGRPKKSERQPGDRKAESKNRRDQKPAGLPCRAPSPAPKVSAGGRDLSPNGEARSPKGAGAGTTGCHHG